MGLPATAQMLATAEMLAIAGMPTMAATVGSKKVYQKQFGVETSEKQEMQEHQGFQ
jgi:hypothetical protein